MIAGERHKLKRSRDEKGRNTIPPNPPATSKHRSLSLIGCGLALMIVAGVVVIGMRGSGRLGSDSASATEHLTMGALLSASSRELEQVPFEQMNLLCAQGLPNGVASDLRSTMEIIDRWSTHVRAETDRNLHKYHLNPSEYNNSEAYFRILAMVTVLQQDLKVHYSEERAAQPDFRDSRDLFIHGILQGRGGTCASMPVLYIAVGRLSDSDQHTTHLSHILSFFRYLLHFESDRLDFR